MENKTNASKTAVRRSQRIQFPPCLCRSLEVRDPRDPWGTHLKVKVIFYMQIKLLYYAHGSEIGIMLNIIQGEERIQVLEDSCDSIKSHTHTCTPWFHHLHQCNNTVKSSYQHIAARLHSHLMVDEICMLRPLINIICDTESCIVIFLSAALSHASPCVRHTASQSCEYLHMLPRMKE